MLTQSKSAMREQVEMLCIEELVPKDHLLRAIDKAILAEKSDPRAGIRGRKRETLHAMHALPGTGKAEDADFAYFYHPLRHETLAS